MKEAERYIVPAKEPFSEYFFKNTKSFTRFSLAVIAIALVLFLIGSVEIYTLLGVIGFLSILHAIAYFGLLVAWKKR